MPQLPRRLSSNANPVRRYPKTLAAVQKKDEPAAASASMVSTQTKPHLILSLRHASDCNYFQLVI